MKEPKVPIRTMLTIIFAAVVFCIITITVIIVGSAVYLLVQIGLLNEISIADARLPIIVLAIASILIGTLVAAIVSRIPLKPMNKLISGMNQLAIGDFKVRIDLGNISIAKEVSNSFNTLADELENTEMLRSDFVNNFSHEFKTPIVSIRGFAKLLKKGNLSVVQQQEYLEIIVDESTRLADLATNVLNLAKVENQSILTDISYFNLSEQIRNCILLLEKKWIKKKLTFIADFDEYMIYANEELLKQVWINLIDNAVKFSYEGGEIGISITEVRGKVVISVKNNGPEISSDDKKRIFDKFWQSDTSHSSEGTGIGMSIARRIVLLHKGQITVNSSPIETIFAVTLPIE